MASTPPILPYAVPEPRQNRPLLVISMYLLPLILSLLFWVLQDSSSWAGGARPLRAHLLIGLWQATGPLAWVLMGTSSRASIVVAFALAWSGWLTCVLTARLRERPYPLHFLASCLWCMSGCPPAAVVIT